MHSIIKVDNKEIRIAGRLIRTASLEGDRYEFLATPETMIEGLQRCGSRVDLFTFIQRLPETSPKYSYPMEWDNFAALRVSTFEHWWTKQIGFKARNKAKQAEKRGVVIREVQLDEALVKGIQAVYDESPIRQGVPNKHYGMSLEAVYRSTATFLDSSIFIGAFLDDILIGFVKLVYDETRRQAGLMQIESMISQRDKAPSNALIAQAVRSCAERGISYLVYANFAYGKKQHSSLIDFKERNGFQKIDVPRYYVPLSGTGRLAFQLGLHRKLIDYIPESLGDKLREVRAAWYRRKFQSVAEPFSSGAD